MVGGLGCGWAKLNVVQCVGFVRLVAPLLIFAKNSQTALPKKCLSLGRMLMFSTVVLRLQATSGSLAKVAFAMY